MDPELAAGFSCYSGYHATPTAGHRLFRAARRAGCAIAHSDMLGGFHILMDHADVRRAHQQWETFSHEPSVMRPLVDRPGFPPLEYDPPRHTPWRELISRLFNGATAKRIEPGIRADIGRLIDHVAGDGECDLIRVFAEEVPMLALSRVLGLDGDKHAEIRKRTLAVMEAAQDPERGAAAFGEFAAFGVREVEARRRDPREDGLSTIAHWRMGGQRPMTELEIGQAMNSVLIAGHGTSISAIGAMFHEVLSRPGLRDKLRADESLIPVAIEETLRLHPPFFGLYRRTTTPALIAGTVVPADDSVMLCWAAANRDPSSSTTQTRSVWTGPSWATATSPSASGSMPAPASLSSAPKCASCSPRSCAGCPTSPSSIPKASSGPSAAAKWPASPRFPPALRQPRGNHDQARPRPPLAVLARNEQPHGSDQDPSVRAEQVGSASLIRALTPLDNIQPIGCIFVP